MATCPTGAISSTWGVARYKVKSRCFIDDETPTASAEPQSTSGSAMPLKRLVLVMGILLTVGGLLGLLMGFISLYSDFGTRMAIEGSINLGFGSLILATLKIVAACITVGTGIFVLRNQSDAERIKTAREKLGIAIKVYLVGIAAFIVSAFFAINGLGMAWSIIVNFFCSLCLPFMWKLASSVEKKLNGERAGYKVALVLGIIMTLLLFAFVVACFVQPFVGGST